MLSLSEEFAEAVAGLTDTSIPDAVYERIDKHIIDTIGVALAGSRAPWIKPVFDYASLVATSGQSSAVFSAERLGAEACAFGNASAAHGVELDDFHIPGAVHAGCVVVPAAIAVAEEVDASIGEMRRAIVVGYELTTRLGLALNPEMTLDRGFHVTSAIGPIGAAASAALLMDLSPAQTAAAIGIATSSCGGLTEYTRTGGEIKRLHAGLAAESGIRAARLARLGLTAPVTSIEGSRGYLNGFRGSRLDTAAILAGLGETWCTDGLGIKPWATCAGNQPAIAALDSLITKHNITAADISSIDAWVDKTSAGHCGHIGPAPSDMTGLQFSMHVALGLRAAGFGNSLRAYLDLHAGKGRDAVTSSASKVTVHIGDDQTAAFSTRPFATVKVTLQDGAVISGSGTTPGDPYSPLSWDEIAIKIEANALVPFTAVARLREGLGVTESPVRQWQPYRRHGAMLGA